MVFVELFNENAPLDSKPVKLFIFKINEKLSWCGLFTLGKYHESYFWKCSLETNPQITLLLDIRRTIYFKIKASEYDFFHIFIKKNY